VYQTMAVKYLEPADSIIFPDFEIETEFRQSYFTLMEQRLHVEVWDKESLWPNKFLGYASIPLIDIIQGSVKQGVTINSPKELKGGGKPLCSVTFNIFFEEIWDFCINFLDWKTSTLVNKYDQKVVNPQCRVTLDSPNALQSTCLSNTIKNQTLAHWNAFKEGIHYRGTMSDLRNEALNIKLFNNSTFSKMRLGQKNVELRNVINSS